MNLNTSKFLGSKFAKKMHSVKLKVLLRQNVGCATKHGIYNFPRIRL